MISKLLLTLLMLLPIPQTSPVLRLVEVEFKEPPKIGMLLSYTPKAKVSEAQIYLNLDEPVPFLRKVDIRVQKTIWNATANVAFGRKADARPTKEYTYMFKDVFQMMPVPKEGEIREYVVHIETEDGRIVETKPFTILYTK